MKKSQILFTLITPFIITSCSSLKVSENTIVYQKENVIHSDFKGLGVEWGVYEDTNKLTKNGWERITKSVDRLAPSLVRCMTNFDWIVKNFSNNGTSDPNDDTWEYDFNNKYMLNAYDILDYCEDHDIDVAFGVWNVIGNADLSDDWGMIENATSDIRWAKLSADLMDYMVNQKGYTCIKYYVSTNEPNYSGAKGSSKNAYNTYDKWETGIKNVRAAFDKIGLKNVDIIGGDTTGFTGSSEYLPNIAKNLKSTVNNYGIHMYISNYDIDNTVYQTNLTKLYQGIKEIDNSLGVSKDMLIWEAGLLDGKNVTTDCQAYIGNYSYGIRMGDYTLQSILAGVNGICYWDLDDAMHFMYTDSGMTPKEWGMFSSLNDATSLKQEYRPWYHSSTILSNLLTRHSKIYKPTEVESATFRSIASISNDFKDGGIVCVNRDVKSVTKKLVIEEKITNNEKVYVYVFNEASLKIDSEGFVAPTYEFNGSLNKLSTIEVPANSMLVMSSRRL